MLFDLLYTVTVSVSIFYGSFTLGLIWILTCGIFQKCVLSCKNEALFAYFTYIAIYFDSLLPHTNLETHIIKIEITKSGNYIEKYKFFFWLRKCFHDFFTKKMYYSHRKYYLCICKVDLPIDYLNLTTWATK